MTPREHVIRVRCERGYSEGRDDDFAAADATFLLAALDQVTTQRDEIRANRDALAHKVAEQRAAIARVRELHSREKGYEYAVDCPSPEDHRHAPGYDGDEICLDCPTDENYWCRTCHDEDGGVIEWPCATAAVLDGADTTTTDGDAVHEGDTHA